MLKVSKEKYNKLLKLSNSENIISALAIDQRGSLKKMIDSQEDSDLITFKKLISKYLTPFSSSILLDPEYGLPASKERDAESGLILAYEETGYDASSEERYPDLLDVWSVRRLKEYGADAVKVLLYYDVDAKEEINERKQAFVERVGYECDAADIPYFLEIVTYDTQIADTKGKEYAKLIPKKVIEAMKLFSEEQYKVDVLKVETPINMNFVEGYATSSNDVVYSREEAKSLFKEQSDSTHLPYIFLSAGVTAKVFQETIKLAGEAEAQFNGVLCGRATWKESTGVFAQETDKDYADTINWLNSSGKENIEALNSVLNRNAVPWTEKVQSI